MITHRCAILCSGPSVTKCDLSLIDVPVIGINLSYHARMSDIHIFTDGHLIKMKRAEIAKATTAVPIRFNAAVRRPMEGCFTPKKIQHLNNQTYKLKTVLAVLPDPYNIKRDGWIFAGGAPCALQVAVSMKYSEIIFIGLDLHLTTGHHFYKKDISDHARRRATAGAEVQIDFFQQFKPQLDQRGIKVINTALGSALNIFEKRSFSSIWSKS